MLAKGKGERTGKNLFHHFFRLLTTDHYDATIAYAAAAAAPID